MRDSDSLASSNKHYTGRFCRFCDSEIVGYTLNGTSRWHCSGCENSDTMSRKCSPMRMKEYEPSPWRN